MYAIYWSFLEKCPKSCTQLKTEYITAKLSSPTFFFRLATRFAGRNMSSLTISLTMIRIGTKEAKKPQISVESKVPP